MDQYCLWYSLDCPSESVSICFDSASIFFHKALDLSLHLSLNSSIGCWSDIFLKLISSILLRFIFIECLACSTALTWTYGVRLLGDRFVCTCLDFEFRKIDACKHIHMQLSNRLLSGHNYKMSQSLQSADDAIPCTRWSLFGSILLIIVLMIFLGMALYNNKIVNQSINQPTHSLIGNWLSL